VCVYIFVYMYVYMYTYLHICVLAGMHLQVLWVPCMPADIYSVCGIVVGMEVEFIKLLCVGPLPES